MKRVLVACMLASVAAPAWAGPKPDKSEQKEADRHFKAGVALFKEQKYTEALAEFERAYEIAPHPLVLYNIAGCHRELSHYAEAVKYYGQFLTDGKGKVAASRLTAAQTELDGILARIARVTITVSPADGATLELDGNPLGTLLEMPLILAPGEHKFVARAAGHADAERTLKLASGDEVTVELKLVEAKAEPPQNNPGVGELLPTIHQEQHVVQPRMIALSAGFGTNLRDVNDSGAPSLGIGVLIGSRLELGVDATLVAYAVMPSARVRLAGDALSLHVVGAVPISITDDNMTKVFVAGALGLGVRFRATPALSFRVESFASYAGSTHGTTIPTFLGGELWF